MRACPSCGESNPDRFKECAFCGTALVQAEAPQEERKILTVVFCDLKDSTGLGERLDPEAMGEVLDLYFTAMTRVLQRHGGSIQKFIGDAIVAAFGIPVLHEDDALRGVRAAIEMRTALTRLNRQLEAGYGVTLSTRTGVHTGEVVVRTAVNDQQVLTGDTLNTAARLEQAAGEDEILIGEPTFRLVREAVETDALTPLDLKGKAAPVAAYRLLRVFGDEQAARRHDAPMVGRDAELAYLRGLFDRAVDERRCVLGTVLGDAGVGKSRLVRALLESVQTDANVLRGRCLPYGDGITFWPLLTIVRDAAQVDPDDPADVARERLETLSGNPEVARRVASALGWSTEELPVAELFWGIRELLEHLAGVMPLVVVIDDIHWAAPTLLALVDHLVANVEGARILVLCTARPDMLETQPDWSVGPNAGRLVLERLPADASAQVLENMMGGAQLPPSVRDTVLRGADGNPLFVEQLVSMLVDTGILVEVDGQWEPTRELSQLEIPPSIQALLSARLDLLDAVDRGVVEPASVIGLEFSAVAVAGLAPPTVREQVADRLETMVRKRLVRPAPMPTEEEGAYRFDHVLVRDAAYRRVLKRARADLHERFADWLEHSPGARDRPGEYDEIIGYHLEQAGLYRGQLGPLDDHIRQLVRRASERLSAAGRRAFVRGDLPAAIDLFGRGRATLPPDDPMRVILAPDLAEALMEKAEFERAIEVLDDAERMAGDPACTTTIERARLVRLLIDLYSGNEEDWLERTRSAVAKAIPLFEAAGDHTGLTTAWRLQNLANVTALEYGAGYEAAERIITHAGAAGDARQRRRGALAYALSAVNGPAPVSEGIARCEELIATVEGDRRSHAVIELCLGQLLAMDGQIDRARDTYADARRMLEELGRSVLSASTSTDSAPVELLAGDLAAAEELLRRDYVELEELGEAYLRATVAGMLARVLVLRGAVEEAEAIAVDVSRLASHDDVDAQVRWRSALGRCRSLQARHDEAITLMTAAVAMTEGVTAPLLRAQALTDRAVVLAAAGRTPEAHADFATAIGLYEAKGNRVAAEAVRLQAATAAVSSSG